MAEKVASSASDLIERAQKIRLLAMDVDGVLTAGDIIVFQSGEEVKHWNAKDRLGIAAVRDSGIPLMFAFITGRSSEAVTLTAADLGVKHVIQKSKKKKEALIRILEKEKLTMDQAAFIGDDLIDLAVLRTVGFSACPSDATPDVRERVHYISPLAGGRGAVRDILEFILRAQGRWEKLVESFLS